jgi:toxin YoeB
MVFECLIGIRIPLKETGKREVLKEDLKLYWSSRVTSEHRLVYKYEKDQL